MSGQAASEVVPPLPVPEKTYEPQHYKTSDFDLCLQSGTVHFQRRGDALVYWREDEEEVSLDGIAELFEEKA